MTRSLWTWTSVTVVAIAALVVAPAGATSSPKFVTSVQYSIKLGSAAATGYAQVISQSTSTNNVYVGEGSKVLVVKGHASPVTFLTAPAPVLALCATSSALYIETSKSVLEYEISNAAYVGTWSLPSGLGPSKNTQAGMSVEGGHLWTWTDWSTDQSGYEYGSVVEFNLSNWTSKVYDKEAVDPGDVAASSLGYFFLANNHVVRVEPGGVELKSAKTADASDAPMAVLGNSVYLVATREPSGKDYLDSFNAANLSLTHSAHIASTTYGILGTPLGLVGIYSHGSTNDVVMINAMSGAETDDVTVHGAQSLLYGSTLTAVADVSGQMYLDRLH